MGMPFGLKAPNLGNLGAVFGGGKASDLKRQLEEKQRPGLNRAGSLLADMNDSDADKPVTRAQLLALLSEMGYARIPAGYRTDSDTLAASVTIDTNGSFPAGGAAVMVVQSTGQSDAAGGVEVSRPHRVTANLSGSPLMNSQAALFIPTGTGAVAYIPYGEVAGTNFAGTVTVSFVTGDVGTVETAYFPTEEEAQAFMALLLGQ